MDMTRRGLLVGGSSAWLVSGCRGMSGLLGSPRLRFGVVSDIHITTRKSCKMFRRALEYYRRRDVDAVVVAGDLTDWGLVSSLTYVKETWDAVFAGTDVKPIFCTGNHDFEGWWYGDMTMEMHANGYHEREALEKVGLAAAWERVFGEKYDDIRVRTVKGFDFVSGEFKGYEKLADWLKANGSRFANGRPFFYFQHMPIRGTTADSFSKYTCDNDGGLLKAPLSAYPNCIAFTGHTHRPFTDERQIWQGAFTVIGVPSLSYACLPWGYENGGDLRNGKATATMPIDPVRRDLRGGQGFVVNVWDDQVVVERRDLEEWGDSAAPDWVLPRPLGKAEKPYAEGVLEKGYPVPAFPSGARLDLETRNTENRAGKWAIVMNCEFPSAVMPKGTRVFDYEIKAVPKDGSAPLVKRFVSPAFAKMEKHEPTVQRFWFDVAELPQEKDYMLEVRARNCFGKASAPLLSEVWHSEPGLGEAVR